MKTCKICQQAKPETEFHKDRQKADGLAPYCKPCLIAKQREYQKRPPRNPAPEGFKRCGKCKEVKALDQFHTSTRLYDGHAKLCKPCQYETRKAWALKYPEKAAALQKRWRDNNPERAKELGRKYLYGLQPGEYDRMLQEQNGRCAICKTDYPKGRSKSFHVDHCHETGKVRGLLCHGCNVSIGHFNHDVEVLQSAIRYLLVDD